MTVSQKKQYWKLQKKQARRNIFESEDIFLQSAYEYFSWCDKNPCYKSELIKSGAEKGTILEVPVLRPYSLSGFCTFWGWSLALLTEFRSNCSVDFRDAIEQVDTIIETQQFEGAAIGIFSPAVINRKQNNSESTVDTVGCNIFSIDAAENISKKEFEKLIVKLQE